MASGTRARTSSSMRSLIGKPEQLPQADLPTRRNVLQRIVQVRLQDTKDKRHNPIACIASSVADEVRDHWLRINSGIGSCIVTKQEVIRKIVNLYKQAEEVATNRKKKVKKGGGKARKTKADIDSSFLPGLDSLFDI